MELSCFKELLPVVFQAGRRVPIWGLHHVVGRDGTRCFDLAGVAIASATHRYIYIYIFCLV